MSEDEGEETAGTLSPQRALRTQRTERENLGEEETAETFSPQRTQREKLGYKKAGGRGRNGMTKSE
jgi:hypothetical protein